ncbi:ABC transporter ATP-binding protein [Salinicola peritrichatus]|uniref:ABC transporter ATP-binding protein n=1 Tax=Salinicola peritrichatus TaxID=1267424 RepID=UPI000DA14D2E|nr:oligopeptide/dipeptide ABC transporter ATP-binding protein [Salinicola peritrichatus]
METLLSLSNISKWYPVGRDLLGRPSGMLRAVNDISLEVKRGETLALVGESGCGKSTLARLMLRLLEPSGGRVIFDGEDISHWSARRMRPLRARMQLIFQDPFSSLNPRMTVGDVLEEPLRINGWTRSRRRARVAELLATVGLHAAHAERYPHEFSGGQRQRVGIARALACGPEFIVGDEPVSALDVLVQAQIINLLGDLKAQLGLTLVMIAHDLSVVRHMADRVGVMYLGEIVELTDTRTLFERPRHPYTRALIEAVPQPNPHIRPSRDLLEGESPSPLVAAQGCRFAERCPLVRDRCHSDPPVLRETLEGGGSHQVACHFWREADRGTPIATAHGQGSARYRQRLALFQEQLARQQRVAQQSTTDCPTIARCSTPNH